MIFGNLIVSQLVFFFILIIYLVVDYFLFCRPKNITFSYYQIVILIAIMLTCIFQIIKYDLSIVKKVEIILANSLLYLSSYFVYLNISSSLKRSITFPLLILYYRKKEKDINLHKIFSLKKRFNEIKKKKLVYLKNKQYVLTKKGNFFLKVYKVIINFFKIKVME